jgi:class 3 adenylate cyclase/tetratricopeptide (TPR) repeat protein
MRFCGKCGTALAAAPSATEERKLVTILFVDVVNSTQLAGAFDPERLRQMMARLFTIAREEIDRYGGTLEKFIGDAILAIFGLPATHEDDPERAVRAAGAIRDRVGAEVNAGTLPQIRIGINTGEVVADPGATEKGERLITGEAVNFAARLQQHAEPGQILAGDRTVRALRGVARVRAVPTLTVKGTAAPLPAWTLLDISPPRERELRPTPFVGRDEELDLLASHVRRMRREGRGHVVTILGQGGVGKTRLIQELRTRTEDAHTLRGRALPYGTGVPFWSLGEAIREECSILFGDPLDATQRKLHDVAEQLGVSAAVPALQAVLGLGVSGPELTREALFAGMRSFFQALARRTPILLILEDMHSADDVTLYFVEHAADWIRDVPMMLLVLSRPELLERTPAWLGGKRSTTTLFLEPLGEDESRKLARGLLGGKRAPELLLDLVLARASGNPLFMEEMLRSLIERGALREEPDQWSLTLPLDQVSIPDTVHAVIAARIDALPAAEKRTLQAAAVIGKDFWLGALRAIMEEDHVEETIQALTSKDLVVRKPLSTLVGEEEITFRHILIRDVAYAMIPKALRWPKHAQHAVWLRKVIGDRHAEYADFIAHHWLQVIALRTELGLPPDAHAQAQAVTNLLLAGDRAASVYATTTALDHYSRALDLDPPPLERLRALYGRGDAWMFLGQFERAREDFTALRLTARGVGEAEWEAEALDRLGLSFRRQDQVAPALEHLEQGLALSRLVGNPLLTARILNHIGFTHFSGGMHAEGIQAHEEARRLLETRELDPAGMSDLAESLHGLGEHLHLQAHFRDAITHLSESIRISDRAGNRSLAAENRYMVARARRVLGEYMEAYAEAMQSLATLDEIGDVWNLSFGLFVTASLETAIGEFGKALEHAGRGLHLARQLEATRAVVFNLLALGAVRRELEDYRGAWQADREAADLAGRVGGAWMPRVQVSLALDAMAIGRMYESEAFLSEARRVLSETQSREDFALEAMEAEGRMRLAQDRPAEARAIANALAEMLTAGGVEHWRAPALLLESEAAMAIGEPQAAVRLLEAVVQETEARHRLPLQWRALAGLAEAQRAIGHSSDAAAAARWARGVIERLAATVPDERLRATFLQSAKVQRVNALAGA